MEKKKTYYPAGGRSQTSSAGSITYKNNSTYPFTNAGNVQDAIDNLYNLINGIAFDFVSDSDVKYIKDVPADVQKKAKLVKLGGATEEHEGALKSAEVSKIVSVGFNIWDEEWELAGFNFDTGKKTTTPDRLCSKNYIDVFPNSTYYAKEPGNTQNIRILFYDINKSFINSTNWIGNQTFNTPSNCMYIQFGMALQYGITYNHDICINKSNASLNGIYKPYTHSEAVILQAIQDLEGYGQSHESDVNEVDFTDKIYHKKGYYDDTNTWVADVEDIDLSDILTNEFIIEVESGGTIEFVNENEIAVPSTVNYMVKL